MVAVAGRSPTWAVCRLLVRLDRPRPVAQSGVEAHGPVVGPDVCEAVAGSAAAEAGRHRGLPGSWNSARVGDLTVVGQSVSSLRVRRVAGEELRLRQVRASRG